MIWLLLALAQSDLVEPARLDPTIKLDVRYATVDNFIHRRVYGEARVFLQRTAAEALVRVHRDLARAGYGLVLLDGYRPWSVTRVFWEATPAAQRAFVADPRQGSRHNRGCAIDLTLYDRATGATVAMPSEYDEPSPRAAADYPGGTVAERRARDLLRAEMERAGFTVLANEWWHFDWRGWRRWPILDFSFADLAR